MISLIMRGKTEITKRRKESRHAENRLCLLQERFVADLAVRITSSGSWCRLQLHSACQPLIRD